MSERKGLATTSTKFDLDTSGYCVEEHLPEDIVGDGAIDHALTDNLDMIERSAGHYTCLLCVLDICEALFCCDVSSDPA